MRVSTLVYSALAGLAGFAAVTVTGHLMRAPRPDGIFATGTVATFQFADAPKPVTLTNFVDGTHTARKLSDFKGKTVLVNLWATWCAPCIAELPELDRLQRELGSDKFEVVAISVDTNATKAKEKLAELKIEHLAFYHDPRQDMPAALGAEFLPISVLLDGETRELGRMVGPAKWNKPEAHRLIEDVMNKAEKKAES